MMADSLKDKAAIVTGGSSGIGSATVKWLLEAGMKVAIVDVDKRKAETLQKAGARSDHLVFVEQDLLQFSSLDHVVRTVDDHFGRIDLLVNCAGIFPFKPVLDMAEEEWDNVLDLNLKAPVFLSKVVANYMIQRGIKGSIIHIASTAATMPRAGTAHYAVSKAGLVMLTRVLALEWASYGIRVNAVCPGVVETETLMSSLVTNKLREEHREKISKIPLSRAAHPDEIAKSVLYLADDEFAGFITGQAVTIDGGYTAGQVYKTWLDRHQD